MSGFGILTGSQRKCSLKNERMRRKGIHGENALLRNPKAKPSVLGIYAQLSVVFERLVNWLHPSLCDRPTGSRVFRVLSRGDIMHPNQKAAVIYRAEKLRSVAGEVLISHQLGTGEDPDFSLSISEISCFSFV